VADRVKNDVALLRVIAINLVHLATMTRLNNRALLVVALPLVLGNAGIERGLEPPAVNAAADHRGHGRDLRQPQREPKAFGLEALNEQQLFALVEKRLLLLPRKAGAAIIKNTTAIPITLT